MKTGESETIKTFEETLDQMSQFVKKKIFRKTTEVKLNQIFQHGPKVKV